MLALARVEAGLRWTQNWVMPVAVCAAAVVVAIGLESAGQRGRASAARESVQVGEAIRMGNGTARSWVRFNRRGNPAAVGVTFSEAALSGLPESSGQRCGDRPEFLLRFPADLPALPFDHLAINWNPQGREPAGVYDRPHFDFHFYMASPEQRARIMAAGDAARLARPLPPAQTPAGYVPVPGRVPNAGTRWVDPTSPEFVPGSGGFAKTFLYGSYDGRVTCFEPMITMEYLRSKPNSAEPLKLPQSYPTAGYFPTSYRVRYDATTREYAVALEGLTLR